MEFAIFPGTQPGVRSKGELQKCSAKFAQLGYLSACLMESKGGSNGSKKYQILHKTNVLEILGIILPLLWVWNVTVVSEVKQEGFLIRLHACRVGWPALGHRIKFFEVWVPFRSEGSFGNATLGTQRTLIQHCHNQLTCSVKHTRLTGDQQCNPQLLSLLIRQNCATLLKEGW